MSSSNGFSSKFKNKTIDPNIYDNNVNEIDQDRYKKSKITNFINTLILFMLVILIVIATSIISTGVIVGPNLGILKLFEFIT